MYPRPDGTVYVTGFPDPPAMVTEPPDGVTVRAEVTARLASTMRQVSSEMTDAPVTLEQACHLPMVGDGTPMMGPVPGVGGAFVATGNGCWGILCGPATGLGMAGGPKGLATQQPLSTHSRSPISSRELAKKLRV